MCGLAAFISKRPKKLESMRGILDEIGIRGLHSTGVSWIENGEIKTKIEPVPYFEFEIPDVETTSAIFHTRYSTSNIDYPQPVHNEDKSVVHNGVITQMDFGEWKSVFGYGGSYRCDSVLLLGSKEHPLKEFEDSSMAVIELTNKGLVFYRNSQRPLYLATGEGLMLLASTKRALGPTAKLIEPGYNYSCSDTFIQSKKKITQINHDFQDNIRRF